MIDQSHTFSYCVTTANLIDVRVAIEIIPYVNRMFENYVTNHISISIDHVICDVRAKDFPDHNEVRAYILEELSKPNPHFECIGVKVELVHADIDTLSYQLQQIIGPLDLDARNRAEKMITAYLSEKIANYREQFFDAVSVQVEKDPKIEGGVIMKFMLPGNEESS